MGFVILRSTYMSACPQLSEAEANDVIDRALARALEKHPDWAHFERGIEQLSLVFFCVHARFPLDDYLEALYCTVKHAQFARPWRAELRRARAAGEAVQ